MNPRQVTRLAQELAQTPAAQVDEALRRRHLDAETRLAVKLEWQAQAGRTMQAGAIAPPLQRLLDTLDVGDTDTLTAPEMDAKLREAGITDPETRIACKVELERLGRLRGTSPVDRILTHLHIYGPVSLAHVEAEMDRQGLGVTIKNVVKAELVQRRWLTGTGGRSMSAAADRGVPLVDRRGHAITLKSVPE